MAIRQGESPAERGRALAAIAREHLAEAQAINREATGQVPPHETWVDGRHEAPLESVKPDGVIVFEFDLINELFEWIGEMLLKHSPVLSGRYSDSHTFFADGVEVPVSADIPEAQEYAFVAAVPYARKIERGLSSQAPDGVYEGVAALAARRFGNLARIRFTYRAAEAGKLFDIARIGPLQVKRNKRGRFVKGSHTRAGNQAHRAVRQPAIVISMR